MAITSYKVTIEFDIDDYDGDNDVTPEEIQKVLTATVRDDLAADNVEVYVEELDDEDED